MRGVECRVWGAGCGVWGAGCGVQGAGCGVQGARGGGWGDHCCYCRPASCYCLPACRYCWPACCYCWPACCCCLPACCYCWPACCYCRSSCRYCCHHLQATLPDPNPDQDLDPDPDPPQLLAANVDDAALGGLGALRILRGSADDRECPTASSPRGSPRSFQSRLNNSSGVIPKLPYAPPSSGSSGPYYILPSLTASAGHYALPSPGSPGLSSPRSGAVVAGPRWGSGPLPRAPVVPPPKSFHRSASGQQHDDLRYRALQHSMQEGQDGGGGPLPDLPERARVAEQRHGRGGGEEEGEGGRSRSHHDLEAAVGYVEYVQRSTGSCTGLLGGMKAGGPGRGVRL